MIETIVKNDEKKEEFDKKLSDQGLISQINKWYSESDDLYGMLKRVWDFNLKYYKGLQTEVEKIRGKESKAVENRIFMATETMIPIATSRLPDIVVTTEDESEMAQLECGEIQDILNYHMERVGIQELSEKWLRDMIVKRYGVYKISWNSSIDDLDLNIVDPKRIRFPKYGTTTNELKFIIEDLELSYDQLVTIFGEKGASDIKSANPQDSENKVRKPTFSVQEVWTNEFVVWRAGNTVIKKENPYFDFKNTSRNFFDKPRKPYVIKSLFHTGECIIGDTDYIQQIIPLQDNINKRKRQIENLGSRVGNPILLIDSNVMSEEQAANITNEEGIIIYGQGAADGTKIRFETPGQVPAYLFNDLEFSRQEFDNIWGVHSTTRGEREGRETLGGRKLLKQADLGRIDLVARQLERAMDEISNYWLQLIKLFYTDERSFSIVGDEGSRVIKGFTGNKVTKIRLVVKPGSTLPKDELTIHQEAKELWQLGAIGVKTFYKMLRLPNIDDAMQDFIALKTGAIFQGGGAPVVPQQAQQQPTMTPEMGSAQQANQMLQQPI